MIGTQVCIGDIVVLVCPRVSPSMNHPAFFTTKSWELLHLGEAVVEARGEESSRMDALIKCQSCGGVLPPALGREHECIVSRPNKRIHRPGGVASPSAAPAPGGVDAQTEATWKKVASLSMDLGIVPGVPLCHPTLPLSPKPHPTQTHPNTP